MNDSDAASKPNRVPLRPEDFKEVMDPLSALLLPSRSTTEFIAPTTCDRRLRIFDGQRRYDLSLAYSRLDSLEMAAGNRIRVLVCGVKLELIAGYRRDSMIIKYVADRKDMELWFVPITGRPFPMPVSLKLQHYLGNSK